MKNTKTLNVAGLQDLTANEMQEVNGGFDFAKIFGYVVKGLTALPSIISQAKSLWSTLSGIFK